jgi:DNA-binding NarL/FixJ family response regulator
MRKAMVNRNIQSHVVIVDGMQLRRAQIAAFLLPWCVQHGLDLQTIEPDEIDTLETARMIVLPFSASYLTPEERLHLIQELRQSMPQVPIVILTDHASQEEIVAALEAGVMGYIPGSIEPHFALDALTFILEGGHYFPTPASWEKPASD